LFENLRNQIIKRQPINLLVPFVSTIAQCTGHGAEEPEINGNALERISADGLPSVST
jgi:hypothetical protein